MDFEVRNNGAAGILGRHGVFLILDYYYRLIFEIINSSQVKRSHASTASQTLQSGSNGTVLRNVNGGKTFNDVSVANATERDFRDVHAFDANTAIVMNAGSPGVFFRTLDGGKIGSRVYNDLREDIFFDALDFWDDRHGVASGDPIEGR
jgi:photosystem II stability/assembly factor-like uncharacterized protein